MKLAAKQLKYWLALWAAPKVGFMTAQQLWQQIDDIEALFGGSDGPEFVKQLPDELRGYLKKPNWRMVDATLNWLQLAPNHHLLTPFDAHYPSLLRASKGAPMLLFVKGNPSLLSEPQLAIVGSRNPTASGRETATTFAGRLNEAGLVITSGLALGIDTAAHQGALVMTGKTIAVMGTGIDRLYPARNRDLAQAIVEKGALVTEFPLGMAPQRENFPQRNRIVSGMSVGTLVIEATLKSGSLITARLAGEQGREVFAIPGSIHSPLARGCHKLIREGAKLVETTQDVLEELGPLVGSLLEQPIQTIVENHQETTQILDDDYKKLLECIGFEPTAVATIIMRSGLPAAAVSSMLLQLELSGKISNEPGGFQKMERING